VFAARATLVDLAVPGVFGVVLLAAALAAVLYYGRLLLIGVAPPSDVVLTAQERPTKRQPEPVRRVPRPGPRRRRFPFSIPDIDTVWLARRTAIAAGAVLVLAALSVGVAGGSFGVRAAAEAPPRAAASPDVGASPEPDVSSEPLPSPAVSAEPTPSG
jgi:hypothetical protein